MAVNSTLKPIAREIVSAAQKAAQNQRVTPDAFVLWGSLNEDVGHIRVTFRTTKEIDDNQLYKDFFDEIRRLHPNDPSAVRQLGLIIRHGVDETELDAWPYYNADEVDISDLLTVR